MSPKVKIICLTSAFPFADQPAGTMEVLSSMLSTNVCLNLYVNGDMSDRGTETIVRPLDPAFTRPDAVLFFPMGRSEVFTHTRAVFGGMFVGLQKSYRRSLLCLPTIQRQCRWIFFLVTFLFRKMTMTRSRG